MEDIGSPANHGVESRCVVVERKPVDVEAATDSISGDGVCTMVEANGVQQGTDDPFDRWYSIFFGAVLLRRQRYATLKNFWSKNHTFISYIIYFIYHTLPMFPECLWDCKKGL